MTDEIVVPGAALMESMRAVGYSLSTALADIIDNSIAAGADKIDIATSTEFHAEHVAILDNGIGMSREIALQAMQLAGMSTSWDRSSNDLGRFGLGLKTASLSQARRLIVCTKQDELVTTFAWDLDHIAKTNRWSLQVLEIDSAERLPLAQELLRQDSGTLVIWQNLDNLIGGAADPARVIDEKILETRDHISLVFHRFIAGEPGLPKISITLNGTDIESADPFLTKSSRTQISRREELTIDGSSVHIQAYTLPFLNTMSANEKRRAHIAGSLRDSQGFYVYRAGRLVIWGTWFRLAPKTDLGKLARVKVDIPTSLDHLWSLDIKKSSAVPPSIVRNRLKMLAAEMLRPSQDVHTYRGRSASNDDLIRPWMLVVDRDNFRYEINRDHPLIQRLVSTLDATQLDDLKTVIDVVEATFPVHDMFNRMAGDQVILQDEVEVETLKNVLANIWHSRPEPRGLPRDFVVQMLAIEPLNALRTQAPEITRWLEESDTNGPAH